MKSKLAKGIVWGLSDLYKGIHDPKITRDKKWIEIQSKKLTKKYKDALVLPEVLLKYESIIERLWIYAVYANLLHSQDTKSHEIGKFYQESRGFINKIESELLWLELELKKLDRGQAVKPYNHYLMRLRSFRKYTLSEPEEVILTKKSQSSRASFIRFYDEKSTSDRYVLKIGKKSKKLSYSELTTIMAVDKSRDMRELAAEALAKGTSEEARFYTYVLNSLLLDKKITDEIRGYSDPQQGTFLDYETPKPMVDALTNAIQSRYGLCERFYKLKGIEIGIKNLYEWDRYSQIYPDLDQNFTWVEAKGIVLDAFGEFSHEFKKIAEKFFKEGWIDAQVRDGKRGGAFCNYLTPSTHPYVLVNFNGKSRDVMTLAHELGLVGLVECCR